ncbi:MAG: hypothetical protein GY825_06490 [Phycisphaeraceae bacterium]|nr:hypothetical protein [Phycisphaeraceae bacterium]
MRQVRSTITSSAALFVAVLAVGCSTPTRNPVPREHIRDASPPGMESWRITREDETDSEAPGGRRRMGLLADQMRASGLDKAAIQVLAISGGGENGAYGAGLLCGWSELGTRPTFNVVTGVSTGALTAPFAFLGSDYDEQLKTCYTTLSTSELVTERGLLEGLTSDALSDPDGLREMLSTQFDEEAFRRMGEEHLKGRRLFVGTTNLDRMEASYWCLSAIAADDVPNGRALAIDIIIASASIPGVFPPVLIEVLAPDGRTYDEMHVDGGVSAQVFTYPVALRLRDSDVLADGGHGTPTVWVIRNAPLVFRYKQVARSLFEIAGRSISGLIRSNGIGDLYRIWLTSVRDGFDFHLASIPFDFDVEPSEAFDPVHMKALFERGRSDILTGEAWRDHPPQIDAVDVEALRSELNARSSASDQS